ISEESAAQKLYQYRKAHKQFISESFSTISAFGPNSSIIHYNRSKNHIIKDNIYLIDSGGHYFGATTDVTRTVSFGNPSEEQKFRYTLVLKSMIALSDAYFSENTTTSKLDEIARKNILNNGFDYGHGTSHGVGNYLCVHEPPHISKKNDEFNIHENIIISNEPGVYVENEYGIRIENL
uniref:Peptidase M24 domain-containing protein n=1 Tax=Biomphalaria glabrata TaxID=6526 RepID=A0A2C9KYG6_BIOGL